MEKQFCLIVTSQPDLTTALDYLFKQEGRMKDTANSRQGTTFMVYLPYQDTEVILY